MKREGVRKEEERSKSKPGSGRCWKKGITITEEFNLTTENNRHPGINCSEIKALKKPILLNKFNVENNYQPGNQRLLARSYTDLKNEVLHNGPKTQVS